MEQWTELYKEISDKILNNLPAIKWVDLWHDQVSYLTDELPFPVPAVFIAFRTLSLEDHGQLIQQCTTQIDLYLFYETFSDTAKSRLEDSFEDYEPTFTGSYNQSGALDFLSSLTDLHRLFHGRSGDNHNAMRRIDMAREESGGAGNLYRISFECTIEDSSAMNQFVDKVVNEVVIEKEPYTKPTGVDNEPLFILPG